MSNSLVKLIDNSLLPAVLIIFGKFFGIYLFAGLLGVDIGVQEATQTLFSFRTVVGVEDIMAISTYSDMFMFALISIGFAIVVVRSVYMHDSHISVSTITKLAKLDMTSLIKTSYELYHTGVVWFVFTWMGNVLILVNALLGKTQATLLIATVAFSLVLSLVLFRDVIKEIELSKQKVFDNVI